MKGKSAFKLIVSEITAIGINVVPLALWLFEDYSAETTMVLYALESCVAIILAVLCVLLLAPKIERRSDMVRTLRRSKIIADFLLIAGFFAVILLTLLLSFIFVALKASISLEDIKFGMMFIAAFQLFEFFSNLYLLRPLSLQEGESLLGRTFGGLALLHISILVGGFLAIFVSGWFTLPFIVFRLIIDVTAPILYFKGKAESPNLLAAKIKFKK